MPASVSAIRTGALPSRGSGVTVFVTNASSCLAVPERSAHRGSRTHSAAHLRLTVKLLTLTAVPAGLMTLIFPVVAPEGTVA